jgi:hypothetical protein
MHCKSSMISVICYIFEILFSYWRFMTSPLRSPPMIKAALARAALAIAPQREIILAMTRAVTFYCRGLGFIAWHLEVIRQGILGCHCLPPVGAPPGHLSWSDYVSALSPLQVTVCLWGAGQDGLVTFPPCQLAFAVLWPNGRSTT